MGGEDKYYSDNPPKKIVWLYDLLHKILPIIVILLIVYMYVYVFRDLNHVAMNIVEYIIISYFVGELAIAFILYENKKVFFKKKWIHILLILPFLSIFRLFGRIGILFESIRVFQSGMVLELGFISRFTNFFSRIPYIQKALHILVDIPKVIKIAKKKLFIGSLLSIQIRGSKSNTDEEND